MHTGPQVGTGKGVRPSLSHRVCGGLPCPGLDEGFVAPSTPQPCTRQTLALTSRPQRIVRCELVPSLAMSRRSCCSPTHVLGVGHRFQVIGANTMPRLAQVVKFQPLRDWAYHPFVQPPVCSNGATFKPEKSILVGTKPTSPQPTIFGLDDVLPEPIFRI